jgi:hypothetical protein
MIIAVSCTQRPPGAAGLTHSMPAGEEGVITLSFNWYVMTRQVSCVGGACEHSAFVLGIRACAFRSAPTTLSKRGTAHLLGLDDVHCRLCACVHRVLLPWVWLFGIRVCCLPACLPVRCTPAGPCTRCCRHWRRCLGPPTGT